jgi:hypothetical protein
LVVCSLLCGAKLSKDSNFHFFGHNAWSLSSDNLTKVIMEALTIAGGLPRDWIAQKIIYFKAYGVKVFQGAKNGVTKYIHDTFAPHSIGVHCMAHCTNLVV